MSLEPRIIQLYQYNDYSFEKPAPFNVLNDVPLSKEQSQGLGFIDNFGLKI